MIRVLALALIWIASAAQAADKKPPVETRSVIFTGPAQLFDDAERQFSRNSDVCALPKGALKLEYELHRREISTDDARSRLQARVEKTLGASNLTEQDEDRFDAETFLRWLGSTRTMMRVSSAPGTDVNSDGFQKGFTCLVRRFEDQGYPTVPTLVAR